MDIRSNIPKKKKSFDDIFKEILETFPPHHIVAFLNSTFKRGMSPDSAVEALRTESNTGHRTIADYFLKVTEPDHTVHHFHIEAQTGNDQTMAFRMAEYGIRFAMNQARSIAGKNRILVELPHAVVFYLRDNRNTPRQLPVIIKAPDGQELHYVIPSERMSDYTPEELLEQNKFPLFPFYPLNFKGRNFEKFEREWQAGCAKLAVLVKSGHMEKPDAKRLLEDSRIVIDRMKLPKEMKEVVRKMISMFDIVGEGIDWIELKRREDRAVKRAVNKAVKAAVKAAKEEAEQETEKVAAVAEHNKAITVAKKALAKGISLQDAADLADLPVNEVEALMSNEELFVNREVLPSEPVQ